MSGIPLKPLGEVGERVRKNIHVIRTARGWSLRQLSEALADLADYRITDRALAYIEDGTRRVHVDDLAAIAHALGVSIDQLLAKGLQPVMTFKVAE